MEEKRKTQYFKVVFACTLAAVLTVKSVCAEENSYAPLKSNQTIYLDTSIISDPLANFTFLSPSEYNKQSKNIYKPIEKNNSLTNQKSTIQEIKPKQALPFSDLNNLAVPSEYIQQSHQNKETFENIFAPPIAEETSNLQVNDKPEPEVPKEIISDKYYAETESVKEVDDEYVDNTIFEGKTISEIKFNGLDTISENTIYSCMKTHSGSIFNTENLQSDLQNIYATGYFTENMRIEPELNENDTICLNIYVNENIIVSNISINGNSVIPTAELYPFVKNLKNLPQNLSLINKSIENINEYYHSKGYTLAYVSSIDDTSDGTLNFVISEGIIDKITFEGNTKTQDFVIERNIMTQAGSVYNEDQIKKDLTKIFATQIFEEVDKKITPNPDKEGEYTVTIKVKEASSSSVTIGGGLDTAIGVFGSASIIDKNFLGRGQQIGLSGIVGSGLLLSDASIKNQMNYQIELNFKEPHFINADNSLISKLYYRDLGSYQVPLAIERRFGIHAIITHNVKNSENIKTSLGTGFEHVYFKEGDYDKIYSLYNLRNIDFAKRNKQLTGGDFLNISPAITYSTLDNEFMPREGTIAKAKFIESFGISNIKHTTGRLAGSITKYVPVFKKSTVSIGAKAGIRVHGDQTPEFMAFRLGGPYNIRGFRMNGVGSGDSFLMASAELQTPIPFFDRFKYDVLKNMRLSFFMDAGKVFDPTITSKLFDRPNSAITIGLGIKMYIPGIGPVSVDYGLPITHVGSYNSKNGYFTFGTNGIYDEY